MDSFIYTLIKILKFFIKPFRKQDYSANEPIILDMQNSMKPKKYSVAEAIVKATEIAESLISPLGEFHWRGLSNPDKVGIGSNGKFHAHEQGDATLHTGSYLASLAYKYKNLRDSETLESIFKILEYFEYHIQSNGCMGRNFVKDEFYLKFPKSEQNGSGSYNLFNEAEAAHYSMRYRKVIINSEVYWQRYDVSVDAISHALFGLFSVYKFVPNLRDRVKPIILSQYNYYKKTDWKIIDDEGNRVRYGDHSPSINFFSRVNELIFEFVETGKIEWSWWDKAVINGVPSYIGGLNVNYFNSFINICQLLVLHEMGVDVKKAISRLRDEMIEFDDNWLLNSAYSYITGQSVKRCEDLSEWYLNYGHPKGTILSNKIVPQYLRDGYNKWEFTPNRSMVVRYGDEITGNHDLLLAYWVR